MKRMGNLFERIVDRDNLRLAYWKARRGKRARQDARRFAEQLEENLRRMRHELVVGAFPVGQFHQFVINDPKERIITAPCFAERVLHHAVMNVCEPVLEPWLIDDTYACRVGRGRVVALQRARWFAHRLPYFLKLDVRKYFDSVPHANLLQRLGRRFKDQRLLTIFGQIVRSFRAEIGYGLPIGSLTSQHFANFYLGWFDRFVKEDLRLRGYIRYMDDMALWASSAVELNTVLGRCAGFLAGELELAFKDFPYINRTDHGMDFLGCRVFPTHMILNRRSRRRFLRKLVKLESLYRSGAISEWELQQRVAALVAFTRTAGVSSWHFRQRLLQQLAVSGQQAPTG